MLNITKYLSFIIILTILFIFITGCGSTPAEYAKQGEYTAYGGQPYGSSGTGSSAYVNPATDSSFSYGDYDYEIIGDLAKNGEYDVDLTQLNSTMVYAQVYDMMNSPDNYLGSKVKMKGTFDICSDYLTKEEFTYCVIADALGCCAQGIEFAFPENAEFPELGATIQVTGVFESYLDGDSIFYRLGNAEVETAEINE